MREGTLRNLAKRLLYALISIVGVAALVFALLHVVPGNPVAALLGDRADPEKVERVSKALGLDQPLYVQFGNYLLGALHGDFGQSYTLGKPVSELMGAAFMNTLWLALAAALCTAWATEVSKSLVPTWPEAE